MGKLTVTVPEELHERIRKALENKGMTTAQFIQQAVYILRTLNVEESYIDTKADESIRALNLMRAHILCQKQLAAVLEIERLTGGV